MSTSRDRSSWSATRRLTAGMLVVWLLISVLAPWFAPAMNSFTWFGFPAGYWIVAQGALFAYLALLVVFVFLIERIESRDPTPSSETTHDEARTRPL